MDRMRNRMTAKANGTGTLRIPIREPNTGRNVREAPISCAANTTLTNA